MVIAAALSILVLTTADPPADDAKIRSALASGSYPWYDSKTDALRPVEPPRQDAPTEARKASASEPRVRLGGIGSIVVILLMIVALGALIGLLVWSFRNAGPPELNRAAARVQTGSAARVGALPPGLDLSVGDLWAEANRRRSIGDFSGAILCLFVHQLLALEGRGLLRLAPGKTARQLVRSIGASEIRIRIESTLRLFEIAFYGHHAVDPVAFEAAWTEAEALQRQWAGEGRS